jgi:serine/threonine protein kinase
VKSFFPSKEISISFNAVLPPKTNAPPLFRDAKKGAKSLTGVTTTSPSITRSLTVPDDDGERKQPGIDSIDGVPLVRYSRYKSEFKELSALGRGGFGTVFKCENALDSREYAIKKIWIKSQMLNGKVTEHFSKKLHRVLREVKILALLDHPNIVRYYTAWLEVDEDAKADDESNSSNSILSPSLFSGLGSTSKGLNSLFKTKGSLFSKSNKGGLSSYMPKTNPLGWNNFGSFRFDESNAASKLSDVDENTLTSLADTTRDDDGFVWERSQGNSANGRSIVKQNVFRSDNSLSLHEVDGESSSSSSGVSSVDSDESNSNPTLDIKSPDPSEKVFGEKQPVEAETKESEAHLLITEGRHVLYIQMQLCSVQTLADFLGNRQARIGSVADTISDSDCYAVDIPFALRLFSQIAHGVKYVHKQGLIHRDLKPQNCFIDDSGSVKVGDFGLSRESSTAGSISAFDDGADTNDADSIAIDNNEGLEDVFGDDAENTAGVGTRAYASPEQMKGSNYDASTDVFSLGLILFEMCYPLYTTHERYKEFSGVRRGSFPIYWDSNIKTSFPSLHDILIRMISPIPSKRPSANEVSEHIDKLLGEYSVQSLDKSWGKKGAILLRVEADEEEGVLAGAMKLIKAASPDVKILQYGLRGQNSKAILEFAIEITADEKASLDKISSSLRSNAMIVRQISNH